MEENAVLVSVTIFWQQVHTLVVFIRAMLSAIAARTCLVCARTHVADNVDVVKADSSQNVLPAYIFRGPVFGIQFAFASDHAATSFGLHDCLTGCQ